MNVTHRTIFALAASVLTICLAAAPSAYAADAMKAGMHKPMKKHKAA